MRFLYYVGLKLSGFKQGRNIAAWQHSHHFFALLSLFLILGLIAKQDLYGQTGDVPCNGNYYFTRQISPSTRISSVNVNASGDVIVTDISSLSPNASTNATGYYNGYIYTQRWDAGSFTLLRVGNNGTYTSKTVSGMPTSNFNNAGVDRSGIMYLLSTDAVPKLYKIDLTAWSSSASLTATSVNCTMTSGSRIWGDIAFDPITDTAYTWYHPSSPTGGDATRGLYQIRNYKSSSPSIVKVGSSPANFTMGTLFFNERGQLFGYGVSTGGGDQKFLYYVDKLTGTPTLLDSSATSSQSDGCECAYRLSLTLTAGEDGVVNIPNCSTPSEFKFDLVANNTEKISFDNINFTFSIDPRFSFSKTAEQIETMMQSKFGSSAEVVISDSGGGTNNKLYISDLSVGVGSMPFEINVKIATGGEEFTNGEVVNFQSHFGGLSEFYGEQEPSSDALTFFGKNESKITFNKTSDLCNSLSGNVKNDINGLQNEVVDGSNLEIDLKLMAVLIDSLGNVYKITDVTQTDGTYAFQGISNGKYSVILTTYSASIPAIGSPAGNIAALPIGWANTGEQLGSVIGSADAMVNGILTGIIVADGNITNANFGINEVPETNSEDFGSEPNPGGTNTKDVTVGFGGTDPNEEAIISSLTITEFPTYTTTIKIGSTTYYNPAAPPSDVTGMTAFPVAGVTVATNSQGVPTAGNEILIDPIDGGNTVVVSYIVTDNAGLKSQDGTLNVPFTPSYTVSGNVLDDINGLENGVVDGNNVDTNLALKAVLVDEDGNVYKIANVDSANGTYLFQGVPNGNYSVVLTTAVTIPDVGNAVGSIAALPVTWANTGEQQGSALGASDGTVNGILSGLTVADQDLQNANFGINQFPVANPTDFAEVPNPGGKNTKDITAGFGGSDPNELAVIDSLTITEFPANVTTIKIGSITYYNAATPPAETAGMTPFPVAGVTVETNDEGVPTVAILIDPIDGGIEVVVKYLVTDEAALNSAVGELNIPFSPSYTVSGNIYNDLTGLVNDVVDGENITSNLGLTAVLVAPNGNVVQYVLVDTLTGTYEFVGVEPNTDAYSLLLTTAEVTNAMLGNPASDIDTTLPANWIHAGEQIGGNVGESDGMPNGVLTGVLVVNADVTSANFGINEMPETVVNTRAAELAPAPGNATAVAGSLFINASESGNPSTTDYSGGTVSNIRFTAFPTGADSITINGNTYNTINWPTNGVTAPYSSSTGVTGVSVYPAPGTEEVIMTIAAVDNGGAEDNSAGSITLLFDNTTISGNVFNDPNAGFVNNSSDEDNLVPAGIYANLLDLNKKVIASIEVGTDGGYTLPVTYKDSYTVKLSVAEQTIGTTLTAHFVPPTDWVYTGAFTGVENSGNTSDTTGRSAVIAAANLNPISNVNFGINEIPETVVNTRAAELAPAPGNATAVAGSLFINASESGNPSTTDYSNGTVSNIRFTAFPTGADSIEINGSTYNATSWPALGVTATYSAITGVSGVSVYPSASVEEVVMTIAAVDNGGAEDKSPGSITLLFDNTMVSGNVFNDPDAAFVNNSTTVANLVPAGIYASLLNSSGIVTATVEVATDGSYTLPITYQDSFNVKLSSGAAPLLGSTLAADFVPPTGWIYTGTFTGAAGTGNTLDTTGSAIISATNLTPITDVNFGINQIPETVKNTRAAQLAPAPGNATTVAGSLFINATVSGDPSTEDYSNGTVSFIRFIAFPAQADSIVINGIRYNASNWPTEGVTATYSASTGVSGISVYPSIDAEEVVMNIAAIDNGGAEDSTPGSITLLFDNTTISGTVFNDPNAGNVNNSTGVANLVPSGVYANLLNASGIVTASIEVNTDGTYTLPVTYQSLYSVKLSNAPATIGAALTTSFTAPAGWQVTGAYNGEPNMGNTGVTTGTSATFSVVGLSSYTNVNFGIQKLPETVVNDLPSQFAPLPGTAISLDGNLFVTPVTSGNPATEDYSNGTVEYVKFKSYPSGIDSITIGGITYNIGSWPSAGLQVPFNPATGITGVSVYPATGVTGVSISIAAIDNSGAEDPTPGRITIPFGKAPIRGVVYNDPNAGNINNSTGSANSVPSGLYANLLNDEGKVMSSILVAAQGTYTLEAPYSGDYQVKITNYLPVVGTTLSDPFTPPTGWSYRGAYRGASNTGNTGDTEGISSVIGVTTTAAITNVNFGVQQLPQTVVNVITDEGGYTGGTPVEIPAVAFTTATLGTDPSTQDYSGGVVEKVRFTEFPEGVDSVAIQGATYTIANWPAAGVVATYTPIVGVTGISVYPSAGISTIILPIASIDNAATQDPTPGKITLNLDAPLPLQLLSFDAQLRNCTAILNWATADEDDCQLFVIERSKDGKHFESIAQVNVQGDNSRYSFEDNNLADGTSYYRLKMMYPASFEFSQIRSITSNCQTSIIALYPNPATKMVNITGLTAGQSIHIIDATGRMMAEQKVTAANEQINIEHFASGLYQFVIINKEGRNIQNFKLMKD